MAPSDVKSFYRQRKKAGGVTKPPPSKMKISLGGLKPAQPAALVSPCGRLDLNGDCVASERLRQFDVDMRYGPCLGMTRRERWDRASRMGLEPPREVEVLLGSGGGGGGIALECLWDGRV